MCIMGGLELLFPSLFASGAGGAAALAGLEFGTVAMGSSAAMSAAGMAAPGILSGFSGLGGLSTLWQVGSTAMQAISGYQQAEAAQQTARNNAQIAEWQAQDAKRRGDYEAGQIRRKAAQVKGAQQAQMAASGLDISYGTAADILDQTDFWSEQDVATARTNAAQEAWARRAQKANYQIQAQSNNPWMAAGSALLTGAGKVADRWYTYSMPSTGSYGNPFFRTVG